MADVSPRNKNQSRLLCLQTNDLDVKPGLQCDSTKDKLFIHNICPGDGEPGDVIEGAINPTRKILSNPLSSNEKTNGPNIESSNPVSRKVKGRRRATICLIRNHQQLSPKSNFGQEAEVSPLPVSNTGSLFQSSVKTQPAIEKSESPPKLNPYTGQASKQTTAYRSRFGSSSLPQSVSKKTSVIDSGIEINDNMSRRKVSPFQSADDPRRFPELKKKIKKKQATRPENLPKVGGISPRSISPGKNTILKRPSPAKNTSPPRSNLLSEVKEILKKSPHKQIVECRKSVPPKSAALVRSPPRRRGQMAENVSDSPVQCSELNLNPEIMNRFAQFAFPLNIYHHPNLGTLLSTGGPTSAFRKGFMPLQGYLPDGSRAKPTFPIKKRQSTHHTMLL